MFVSPALKVDRNAMMNKILVRNVAKVLRASPMIVTQRVLSALNKMCNVETRYRPVAMVLRALPMVVTQRVLSALLIPLIVETIYRPVAKAGA